MSFSILILKPQWLDEILHHGKRMEIRGTATHKVGRRIGLMASKTDHVVGMATITGCVGPMTQEVFEAHAEQHHVREATTLPYKTTYGWILEDVVVLPEPLPHKRKQGAIVFSTYGGT